MTKLKNKCRCECYSSCFLFSTTLKLRIDGRLVREMLKFILGVGTNPNFFVAKVKTHFVV